MSKKINIALLDDHQIVLDGLKLLLSKNSKFKVVAENTNGLKLLNDLKILKEVDVILTDMSMPNIDGLEFSKLTSTLYPHINIIILSVDCEGGLIDKMINESDIKGYLLKTTGKDELFEAIESVMKGSVYFSKEISMELARYRRINQEMIDVKLTQREIEIIKCLATGLSNKEIATELFISEKTVETHRKNIFRKTNLNKVVKLLEFARQHKII